MNYKIRSVAVVTGSRNWSDSKIVEQELQKFLPDLILVGDCPTGVDKFVRNWADATELPYIVFAAEWERYGKKAGPLRNQKMVNFALSIPAVLKYFGFPLGASPGTRDCLRRLQKADIHGKTIEG